MQEKIELKREAVAKSEKEFKKAKKDAKGGGSKAELDKKKKACQEDGGASFSFLKVKTTEKFCPVSGTPSLSF